MNWLCSALAKLNKAENDNYGSISPNDSANWLKLKLVSHILYRWEPVFKIKSKESTVRAMVSYDFRSIYENFETKLSKQAYAVPIFLSIRLIFRLNFTPNSILTNLVAKLKHFLIVRFVRSRNAHIFSMTLFFVSFRSRKTFCEQNLDFPCICFSCVGFHSWAIS